MRIRDALSALLMFCAIAAVAAHVRADFVITTDTAWNGTSPTAAGNWLSAKFVDSAPGTVTLTLSADHLSTNSGNAEDVQDWFFNLDPTLNPSKLNFSLVSQTGSFVDPTINATTDDAQKTQGNVPFDIDFSFAVGNPSNRFVQGDSITYTVTYSGTGTFNANSFAFATSKGSFGPLYDSAHIQNTGSNGQGSGDIGASGTTDVNAPEPAGIVLVPLVGLLLCRMRRRGDAGTR